MRSAPNSRADSRAASLTSTATTFAPRARAIMIADSPTPPQPNTATVSSAAQPSPHPQTVEGRGEPASEPDHGRGRQILGHGHEVRIGIVDDDLIRPRPEMREARLRLIGADLRIAGNAPPARPAPAHEGHGHPLTDVEFLHTWAPAEATRPTSSCPGTWGRVIVAVVAGPRVMIAAAHPGGLDVDDDAGIGGSGAGPPAARGGRRTDRRRWRAYRRS
jgi:hypothetical protein